MTESLRNVGALCAAVKLTLMNIDMSYTVWIVKLTPPLITMSIDMSYTVWIVKPTLAGAVTMSINHM